jgi:hypothetical protein
MHKRSKRHRRRAQARLRVALRKNTNHRRSRSALMAKGTGAFPRIFENPAAPSGAGENRFASRIVTGLSKYRDGNPARPAVFEEGAPKQSIALH